MTSGTQVPDPGDAARPWTAFTEALKSIPSLIERLERLSALWVQVRGRYEAPALAGSLPAEEIDRLLREAHERAFAGWLRLALREQVSDLDTYLHGTGWGMQLPLSKHSFRALVPPFAWEPSRLARSPTARNGPEARREHAPQAEGPQQRSPHIKGPFGAAV
jgi:hypothetical protein